MLLSGDAGVFLAINAPGTILVVLLKGLLAGLIAGLVFRAVARITRKPDDPAQDGSEAAVAKKTSTGSLPAVLAAAIVCPVVNTGIFLLGCVLFFLPTIQGWGAALGFESVGKYMIFGLVGGSFLFELLFNIVLSPVILRLLRIRRNAQAS